MNPVSAPIDNALPGLGQALDGATMAGVFARAWQSDDVAVTDCQPLRIKYRPGRNATLSYQLQVRTPAGMVRMTAAGRLCDSADAARRLARHLQRPGAVHAPAPFADPALGFFGWAVPDDPSLATLPDLLALATHADALGAHRAQAVQLVQYVPESRACVRVDDHDGPTAYAKLDRRTADNARAHRQLLALAHSALVREGRLNVPDALAIDPALGLRWQSAVAGTALLDHAACGSPALARRLGEQLAALHGVDGVPAEMLARPELSAARSRAHAIAALHPDLAERVDRLLHHLFHTMPTLDFSACLHGDLHPRNLLVHGDALHLIDLDGMRRGPAAIELGSWAADGLYRAALAGQPLDATLDALGALLDAYHSAGGPRVSRHALAWATAHALLSERAFRCATNLKTGRPALIPALVALAEAIARTGDLFALDGGAPWH